MRVSEMDNNLLNAAAKCDCLDLHTGIGCVTIHAKTPEFVVDPMTPPELAYAKPWEVITNPDGTHDVVVPDDDGCIGMDTLQTLLNVLEPTTIS